MDDNIIILLLLSIFVSLFLLKEVIKEKRKNRQPTIECRATILSKQVVVNTIRGPYGLRNNLSNLIVFKLSDGTAVELHAPAEMGYPDGTSGILIFQGTKCERFDPDL